MGITVAMGVAVRAESWSDCVGRWSYLVCPSPPSINLCLTCVLRLHLQPPARTRFIPRSDENGRVLRVIERKKRAGSARQKDENTSPSHTAIAPWYTSPTLLNQYTFPHPFSRSPQRYGSPARFNTRPSYPRSMACSNLSSTCDKERRIYGGEGKKIHRRLGKIYNFGAQVRLMNEAQSK